MKNENTKNKKGEDQNVQTSGSSNGCGDIVNDFIEDVWSVMTPKMVDHLKCILKEDMGLSKQDVDKFIEKQREVRRQRICLKKNQRTVRIGPRNQWIKDVSKNIADQMAAIVVGILLSNRTARTKRITEKVLERLCELTGEDTTVESAKTRIERTLVVVADQMASWIDEAISDIEQTIQDKYMSAASLEAIVAEECYQLTTPSSSESSLASHFMSHSEVQSKTTLAIVFTDAEDKDVLKKDDKPVKEQMVEDGELTDEKEGDKELKITKVEESSEGNDVTEESTVEDNKSEEEETQTEEEDTETDEEEVEEIEEEEDTETVQEETESQDDEEEVEEEEVEEEEVEDLDEEELEDEETEIEDSTEEEGKEDVEALYEKIPSHDDNKEQADSSTDLSSVVSSKYEQKKLQGDILDLLKEDIIQLPKEEEESDRQLAMKTIIDKRLEKVAKDKLEQSLDSLVKYDIDKAASIVANWVENILASADRSPLIRLDYKSQGPAFEVKRVDGSQYEVSKVSSTSVAKKVAELRGLDPPLRKKKIPRTMSPINLQSGKDWADWALGAANIGEEWGKWLDSTLNDVENHLLTDRSNRGRENYEEWAGWRDRRAQEAQKWRVEKQKIKDEGTLWNRKLKSGQKQTPPEHETLSHIY